MKIRPLENYKLLGTSIQLDKTQVYDAIPASNQPDYIRDGKVFAGDMLLVRDEYEVVTRENVVNILSMRMLCSLDFDESFTYAVEDIEQDMHVHITDAEKAEAGIRAHEEYRRNTAR